MKHKLVQNIQINHLVLNMTVASYAYVAYVEYAEKMCRSWSKI